MKAAEFLKSRGKPAPSHPVTIRLVSDAGATQTTADSAPARFRFVSDRLKADADGDAAKALAELSAKSVPITDEIRAAFEHSHMLHAALRDADLPAEPFFDSAAECRSLLVPSERVRLLAEYQAWVEKEFPASVDDATFKQMVEDAKGFTVSALLSKFGYWPIRRALGSLALIYGTPPTT